MCDPYSGSARRCLKDPLKLLIDDGMASRFTSGIGSHTRELVSRMRRYQAAGHVVTRADSASYPVIRRLDRFSSRLLYHARLQSWAPLFYAARGYDLIHFANFYAPSWKIPGTRYVVTVHDLGAWDIPDIEAAPKWFWTYGRRAMVRGMRVSDGVIVKTVSTGNRIRDRFGVPENKIFVCPGAVKDVYVGPAPATAGREPIVVFVGMLTRRKNPETLLRAFQKIAADFPDLRLVFVGQRWVGWDAVEAELASSPYRERVEVMHGLTDAQLRELYDRASVLVAPSWYEGFGIPIIEAMARGLPVIASDIEVFREVGASAAEYYGRPDDADALGRAIARLMSDSDMRHKMAGAGLERSREFHYDKIAGRYLEIYRAVLDR